jgi:hypothetical protein
MGSRINLCFPFSENNLSAHAWLRPETEFVAKALCTTQTEAESVAGSVTIRESGGDVRDTGSFILERQSDPCARAAADCLDHDSAAATVIKGISRNFTGSRDDFRLVDKTESDPGADGSNGLTDADDVLGRANL